MGQKSGKSGCAVSAGYEAGSCKKTGDTPETQEELKEKLLYKHQAGESSISDKMMTADDTLSEKGSLMSKFVFSLQQQLLKSSSLNQLLNRSPIYYSNTNSEVVEIKRAVSSAVYCDPDIKQSAMLSGKMNMNSCGLSVSKFLGLGNRHVVLKGSRFQSIPWYDTGHGSTQMSGERLTQGQCGIPLHLKIKLGVKCSALEEILSPVTAGNNLTEDSLLVSSHLQQHSDSFRSGIEVYLPSDREQIALAKTKTVTQSEFDPTSYPINTDTYPQPLPLVIPLSSPSSLSSQPWEGNSRHFRDRRKKKGRTVDQDDLTVCTKESGVQDASELMSLQCEGVSGVDTLQPFMALNVCIDDHLKTLGCNSCSRSPAFYTESAENRSV